LGKNLQLFIVCNIKKRLVDSFKHKGYKNSNKKKTTTTNPQNLPFFRKHPLLSFLVGKGPKHFYGFNFA
jgi:hypothetical protein